MKRNKVRSPQEREYEKEKLKLLGKAIRNTLKELQITQTELAHLINWDRANLTSALHGRKSIPAVKLDQILFCLPDSLREDLYEELETIKETYFSELKEQIKGISEKKRGRKTIRKEKGRKTHYISRSNDFDDFID